MGHQPQHERIDSRHVVAAFFGHRVALTLDLTACALYRDEDEGNDDAPATVRPGARQC